MPTVLNNIGISGDYGQIVFHNDGTDNIIDLSHSNATTVTHDLSINNTLQAGQILGTKSGKVIELSGNALMVPVGTDNQRPDNASGAVGVGEIGMIRYNTTSSTFEGYGPTAWGSLGGVINTQQKTFVEAIDEHSNHDISSNSIQFTTSGELVAVINADGRVGIGSTNPEHLLDVAGNVRFQDNLYLGTSTDSSNSIQSHAILNLNSNNGGETRFYTDGTQKMVLTTEGRLGIGKTQPHGSYALDVSGNIKISNGNQIVIDAEPGNYAYFTGVDIYTVYQGSNNTQLRANNGAIEMYTETSDSSGERLHINAYGLIGIGTNGPSTRLDISNNTANSVLAVRQHDPAQNIAEFYNGANQLMVIDNSGVIGTSGTGALRIPVGNNSDDRPGGANGMIRYNNTDNRYEGYDETKNSGVGGWDALGGGGGGSGQVVTNIRTLTQGETLLNIDISANTSAYMPHKVSMSDDGNRVAIADSTVDADDTTAATVKIYDYNVNNNQYEVKETITVQRDGSITTDAEGIRGIHMTGDKNTILVVTANVTGDDADASDYDGSYNFIPYELTSSDPVTYTPGTALTVDNAPWYDMDDGTTLMIAKKDADGSNRDVYFYNYSGSNKEFSLNQTVSYATDISNALPAGFVESSTTPKHVAISGDGLRALWVEEDRSNIIVFKRLSTFADFQILQTIQLGSGSAAELLHPNFDYAGKFMAVSMPGIGNNNTIKIYAYDETKFNYVLESVFNEIDTLTDSDSLGKQEAHVSKDGTRLFVGASGATNGAIAMLKLDKQGKVPVSSGTATAEHIIYGLSSGDKFGMGLSTDYNGKRMIGVGLESGSSVSNVRVIQTQEESITSSSTFNINEVKSVGGPLLLTPDPAHPRVGINTSPSSSFHLDISGNINISGTINQGGSEYIGSQWTTVNTDEIHYSTGSVGIGTASPSNTLTINGTISDTVPILGLRSGNNSNIINNGAQIAFGHAGHDRYQHFIHTRHNTASSLQAIDFYVCDGTQNNTVTSGSVHNMSLVSGNVGIGTDNPQSVLEVNSDTNALRIARKSDSNDYYQINNTHEGGQGLKISFDSHYYHPTNGRVTVNTLTMRANGNVGIGSTIPGQKLDVGGNTYISGNLGIGRSPSGQLDVQGNINARTSITCHGSSLGSLTAVRFFNSSGGLFYNSGDSFHYGINSVNSYLTSSSYLAYSDSRIKANITDVVDDTALQKLRILKPKTYTYKDTLLRGSKTVYGFIAQEVKEVIPEAVGLNTSRIPNIYELVNVSTSEDGSYNVISFTNFDTSDLDASSNKLVLIDSEDQTHEVNIIETIDSKTIRIDTNVAEWMGAVDASGNITGNTLDASGNVIINGTKIFIYGQIVDDLNVLNKAHIFTVATAALQEVDRQLQAEKAKTATLETEVSTLKTQMADILARVTALESA